MVEKITREDYAGNSRMARSQSEKPAKKNLERVAVGKPRKKSGIRKVMDEFFADDIYSVGSYLLKDVLIPAATEALVECVNDGINALVYGVDSRGAGREHRTNAGRVSYRRYYDKRPSEQASGTRRSAPPERPRSGYDDVVLDTRQDAEDVLNRMYEIIVDYGWVSVCDLYDLVGITSDYTSSRYGWANIESARIVRVREGFVIDLPRPIAFD